MFYSSLAQIEFIYKICFCVSNNISNSHLDEYAFECTCADFVWLSRIELVRGHLHTLRLGFLSISCLGLSMFGIGAFYGLFVKKWE